MARQMEKSRVDEIIDYYVNNQVTINEVVKKFGTSTGTIYKYLKERDIVVDPQRNRKGKKPWNSGLSKHTDNRVASYAKTKSGYINHSGYRKVWSDELKKTVNEHHYIWFKSTNYWPDTSNGEQIHHIDGNKLNNDFDNLMLVSVSDHTKIHKRYEELTCKLISKGYVSIDKQTGKLETEFLWRMLNENDE